MQLSPLSALLLAQVFILLLGGWFFSARKKNLLLRELETSTSQPAFSAPQLQQAAFDQNQAALLLNRMYQNMQSMLASKNFSKESCLQQQELTRSLGTCLGIQLDELPLATPVAAAAVSKPASDDLILQEDLDAILDDSDDEDLDASLQALMADAETQPATAAGPETAASETALPDPNDLDQLLPADESLPELNEADSATADADEALLEQLTQEAEPPKLAENQLADQEEPDSMDFDFTDLERELLAEEEKSSEPQKPA